MFSLRLWAVVLGTCLCPALPAFAQEGQFPYTAYVTNDDVYVRSGPGKSYYPTDKLKQGTPVEVYRHDPGGWLAIRPPEESFSWVSARFLRPLNDGLAVITGEDVMSRVGSRFSSVRDVIQVRLEKGEQVELI
jgi:SH3-like domain-containing protein